MILVEVSVHQFGLVLPYKTQGRRCVLEKLCVAFLKEGAAGTAALILMRVFQ